MEGQKLDSLKYIVEYLYDYIKDEKLREKLIDSERETIYVTLATVSSDNKIHDSKDYYLDTVCNKARLKIMNEKDSIRKIIASHIVDVTQGNKRDNINYVDVLYSHIEKAFGLDVCIESMKKEDFLNQYYKENFSDDISYERICEFINSYIGLIERIKDEEAKLRICDDAVKVFDDLFGKRVNHKKM